jgi:hypothetical protein
VATSEPVVLHHGREGARRRSRRGAAVCFNGLLGGAPHGGGCGELAAGFEGLSGAGFGSGSPGVDHSAIGVPFAQNASTFLHHFKDSGRRKGTISSGDVEVCTLSFCKFSRRPIVAASRT